MKYPVQGRNRCERCGGKSPPAGPTHPRFVHGRTSKLIPKGVVGDRLRELLQDPDLCKIDRDVAVVQYRWSMLLERLTSGESTKHWDRLVRAKDNFQKANKRIQEANREQQEELAKPVDQQSATKLNRIDERVIAARKQVSESLSEIVQMITEGAAQQEQWRELVDVTHQVAALKKAESDRLTQEGMTLNAQEAVILMTATLAAIAKHVTSEQEKQSIAVELARIWQQPGLPPAIQQTIDGHVSIADAD